MSKILTIDDLKQRARKRVPKMFFDYVDSGSWTESTYRANEEDFSKIKLRQRVLVDMADRSLESTMIGEKVSGLVTVWFRVLEWNNCHQGEQSWHTNTMKNSSARRCGLQ